MDSSVRRSVPTPAIRGNKLELLRRRLGTTIDGLEAIRPVGRTQPLSLSFAQERLWFLDRLEAGSDGSGATYTIPLAVRLTGALDRDALTAALGDLVARHESLRTIFPDTLGVPRQLILEASAARPRLTVTHVSEAELPLFQHTTGGSLPIDLLLNDAAAPPYHGHIENTLNSVNTRTGTLEVQATFRNSDHVVLPGQFVRVRVRTAERRHALLVPLARAE